MRSFDWNLRKTAWAVVLGVALTGGAMLAQVAAPAPKPAGTPPAATGPAAAGAKEDAKLAGLWNNLLHYILLARPDVAESYGKAILDAKPDPRLVYYLSIRSDRSGATLARGRGMKKLAPTVDKIVALIEQGALAVRTDVGEIGRWIKMLIGTQRQRRMAEPRLVHAAEYAVPQLIAVLEDPNSDRSLRERITVILPLLGREAVRPLNEALQTKDPVVREVVAQALGQIGYRHAAPYLKELSERKGVLPRARRLALASLSACAGPKARDKSVAQLFYDMAERYYNRTESLNPDARYDTANVWYWQEGGLGLSRKVVPRVIFNEAYAMQAARRALEHDENFSSAIPLWIAANLRKEDNLAKENERRKAAKLPELKDRTRPTDQPGADYYALAAGARYLHAVLGRALKDGDLAVAIRAIAALRRTTGPESLVPPMDVAGGVQPLVAAMSCPARLVRYMAAETLALALPRKPFAGADQVVPTLVEALRQTGAPTVVLADPDLDGRNKVKDLLRAAGCKVVDAGGFGKALHQARDAGGADVCLIASTVKGPDFRAAVALLRAEAVFARTPVVILSRPAEAIDARKLAKKDSLVLVVPAGKIDAAAVTGALKKAAEMGSGATPLTPEASADWAIRAAKALRLLALTKSLVYDLSGATKSLIAASKDQRDPVRVAGGEALAQFRAAEAQQALADLANDAKVAEEVRLSAYASLGESVRLFDNQLTDKQVQAIDDVVGAKGSLKIQEAAAAVRGALSLPSDKAKGLILKTN